MGFAPRSTSGSSSSHVGAIVGGIVGGVAFVVITGFLVFFWRYSHRRGTHRITAAQYDADIEKPADGTVQPFDLQTPTSVQYAIRPESTADSSATTPMHSPAYYAASHQGHANDIAPPSYEFSEGSRSPGLVGPPPARLEKSGRIRSASVSSFQQPPIPLTPITPTSANATHGTAGSSTLLE